MHWLIPEANRTIQGMENPCEHIRVRAAAVGDVAQLCELLSQLFTQEADFAPDKERQSCGLHLILAQPDMGRIYCAEREDRIVGMVSILFSISTAEGGRVACLEDMIVHSDWRGTGIGGQLLRAAIAGAKDAGCLRVTLLTDQTNTKAAEFYAHAGFSRSQMVPMRLKF